MDRIWHCGCHDGSSSLSGFVLFKSIFREGQFAKYYSQFSSFKLVYIYRELILESIPFLDSSLTVSNNACTRGVFSVTRWYDI
jgi:hypothetical protein